MSDDPRIVGYVQAVKLLDEYFDASWVQLVQITLSPPPFKIKMSVSHKGVTTEGYVTTADVDWLDTLQHFIPLMLDDAQRRLVDLRDNAERLVVPNLDDGQSVIIGCNTKPYALWIQGMPDVLAYLQPGKMTEIKRDGADYAYNLPEMSEEANDRRLGTLQLA